MEVFQVERLGRGPAPTQARLHGLKGTGISNPSPPGVLAELCGGTTWEVGECRMVTLGVSYRGWEMCSCSLTLYKCLVS